MNNKSQKVTLRRTLKPKDTSIYLGISTRCLHDLASSGRLPYHRISQRLHLFDIADLDAFLASCKVGGAN